MPKGRGKNAARGKAEPAESSDPPPTVDTAVRTTRSGVILGQASKKKKKEEAVPTGPPSLIASFPPELLFIVFGDVVLFSKNAADPMKSLRMLAKVCLHWKAVIASMPLPHLVVANIPQAERLCKAFEERFLAAHTVKSFTFSAPYPVEPFDTLNPASYISRLNKLWATLFDSCAHVTTLRIEFEVAHRRHGPQPCVGVLADVFCNCSNLANLQELEVSPNWVGASVGAIMPILQACKSLSTLKLLGLWREERYGTWEASPPYFLESIRIVNFDCSCQSDSCAALAKIVGRSAPRRIMVNGYRYVPGDYPRRPFTPVGLYKHHAESVETLCAPLPSDPPVLSALTKLRFCVLDRQYPSYSTEDLQVIASSGVTGIRISNSVVRDTFRRFVPTTFIPFMNGGGFPNVTSIAVEYVYQKHYDSLDQLEVLEDACIANGIEFDLIPEL